MKKQILSLSLLSALQGFADVSLQNASFIQKQNDFQDSNLLERTYSSRSLWQGVFGFGWCAEFEKHVNPNTSQAWHCDQEIPERPTRIGPVWVLKKSRNKFEIYNFRGQLMQIKDGSGSSWILSYDSQGRLSRIHHDRSNQSYNFVYSNFQLQKIEGSTQSETRYEFQGPLLMKTQSGRAIRSYQYDEFQNLTRMQGPDSPPVQIQYDSATDQVRRIQIGACRQDFEYKKLSSEKFLARATSRCPSAGPRLLSYLFTARPLAGGKWQLKGTQISGDNNDPSLLP